MGCEIFLKRGSVPIACLFQCQRPATCVHRQEKPAVEKASTASCKRCGSTDVRWRQQGGRWQLFSLEPGVLHRCAKISASDDFKKYRKD